MISTEECIELLNHDTLELFEGITLNCNLNTLEIPSRDINIVLNESQKRLFICLMKKVCTKRDIINVVWYENHQRISDNNYHQLTFQLRALLQRNNLPANLLITVPYYGLKLNENQWKSIISEPQAEPVTASEGSAARQISEHDNIRMNNLTLHAEKTAEKPRGNAELFMRSLYQSPVPLSQNLFILCLFAALIIFI